MTYIYKLTLKDGGTYIGQRHCQCEPEKDSKYLGSSKSFKKTDVIKKEILVQGDFSDEQLAWLETIAIMSDKCNSSKNYNITLGALVWGKYSYTKMHSEECKIKMHQRALERWSNPEVRSKLEYARRHQNTDEVRKRISESIHKSKMFTKEWSEAHSKSIKSKPYFKCLNLFKGKVDYKVLQKLLKGIKSVEEGLSKVNLYLYS